MSRIRIFKHFRSWSGILTLILVLALLKLALTVGSFLFPSQGMDKALSASAVYAADRQEATSPAARHSTLLALAQPQKSAAAQEPSATSMPGMVSYLNKKQAELKQKEQALQKKEQYLTRMQQQVETKLKKLTAIEQKIQNYQNQKQQNQDAKIRSLAKIYGSMKPKQAAELLQNLDDQLVVEVISTMNTRQAANILANMDVKKAAEISERLSNR